jgi:hypothetical protein
MENIDRLNVAIIKNEIVDSALDGKHYGFLTSPSFKDEGTELDIIFDLLVPTSATQHIKIKSGSKYLLKDMTKADYIENTDVVLDLIQVSMDHTSKMFKQENPEHAYIPLLEFDKGYFLEELERQMAEQGLN